MIVFFHERFTMQEILAPVGNWEMLDAALAAGCDAIYLATKEFGARAYAQNFSIEEIAEIVKRCHLIDVKVHVTLNTILYEDEVERAYEVAYGLYKVGVDALIIQDLGLIHLIHERLPKMCLHASTQMSVMDPDEIEHLKKIGISRVVLARECTKAEIEACKKAGLEIEIFVHGAICISMSGRCYFSSVCYGRSGNRGMCAQPCRMPYTLYEKDKKIDTEGDYLLSPKDLSLIDSVKDFEVDSFKIEGRMKSSAYVYEAVRQVKMVRDGKKRDIADRKALKQAFNRGYTLGHAYEQKGKDLMNTLTSNHQGIVIGKVLSANKRGIRIQLKEDLYQNDGIRIGDEYGCRINYLYDEKQQLQNQIKAGSIAQIDPVPHIQKGDLVRRTISYRQEKEVEIISKQNQRKIKAKAHITCLYEGSPLTCWASDGKNEVYVESDALSQSARNQGLTSAQIEKQMKKTGNTWIDFDEITYEIAPNLFLPMGVINQLRRDVIAALEEKRCEIHTEEALPYEVQVEAKENYLERLFIDQVEGDCAPSTMNVCNSYGVAAIQKMGFDSVVLSDEINKEQIISLMKAYQKRYNQKAPVIVTIYQHRRLMIMRHCPINTALKDGKREHCALCHQKKYTLEGKDGRRYYLRGNRNCFMQVFDKEISDDRQNRKELEDAGIHSFLIRFLDETKEEKEYMISSFFD